jgi:hypothetical protein
VDLQGRLAFYSRGTPQPPADVASILAEASALAWRALAMSQELHERFGAPLAPGARLPASSPVEVAPAKTQASIDRDAPFFPTPDVAPKPLRLEVGKRYLRRDGVVIGRIVALNVPAEDPFTFEDPERGVTYRSDGRWSISPSDLHPFDIVSEYSAL